MALKRWKIAALAMCLGTAFLWAYGCGPLYELAGYPPEVTRRTPPADIDTRAADTLQDTPRVAGPSSKGDWTLDHESTSVLVFYRGHW